MIGRMAEFHQTQQTGITPSSLFIVYSAQTWLNSLCPTDVKSERQQEAELHKVRTKNKNNYGSSKEDLIKAISPTSTVFCQKEVSENP